jgi:hypothetical protein
MKGKKKSSILVPHRKAPKKLVALYRRFHGNSYQLGKYLGVNSSHVWRLLKYGKEPKRLNLREKLFLKIPKSRPKQEVPDYIKKWNKLPTEERRNVIQQYITWRYKDERKDTTKPVSDRT